MDKQDKIKEVIKNLSKRSYTKVQAIKDLEAIIGTTTDTGCDYEELKSYPIAPYRTGMLCNKGVAQVIKKGIYKANFTCTCGDKADYYGHYISLKGNSLYMATGDTCEPLFVLDEDEKVWRKAGFIPADRGACLSLEEDCYKDFYRVTTKVA